MCVCVCVCVCVCSIDRVWADGGDCLGGDACVFYQTLLAFELLAAASDSVSSSPFIRSASRRCHLSFPRAYITRWPLAHTHEPGRPLADEAPRGRSGWLAGLCFCQAGWGERASRIHSVNMQTGWMSDVIGESEWVWVIGLFIDGMRSPSLDNIWCFSRWVPHYCLLLPWFAEGYHKTWIHSDCFGFFFYLSMTSSNQTLL